MASYLERTSTLEQRIEYLFRDRGSCLKEIASIFARRRENWLTQKDIINLIGKKYHNSTICSNFKKLSLPMKELDNHSYIDTEDLKKIDRGRPAIRGMLGKAASDKIFILVNPVEQIPQSCKVGKIEILPFHVEKKDGRDAWLSPEDILRLREQKIGKTEANRLLQNLLKVNKEDTPKKMPFAEHFFDFRNHDRPGPIPRQNRLTNDGLVELASDKNEVPCSLLACLVDTRQELDRIGIEDLEERALKGDQPAFNLLIQKLSRDTSNEYSPGHITKDDRMRVARSLGNIGDPHAIQVLRNACNDPAATVRKAAVEALEKIGRKT